MGSGVDPDEASARDQAFEERAAILEFEAGMSRDHAEWVAGKMYENPKEPDQ